MRSSLNLIYQLLQKGYPANFAGQALKTTDFYDAVYAQLPESWNMQRGDMWFYCSPIAYTPPLHGWKIHISATSENCGYVLDNITSVLVKCDDVSFKFALDRSALSLLNSKKWPDATSGKFITIYPRDRCRFLKLIEEINHNTSRMQGPYMLSDRGYKDSRVVFYRYGGERAYRKR